jgi:serine/threonine protein kinase
MGVVYRARDEKLQRDVALKLPGARPRASDGGPLGRQSDQKGAATQADALMSAEVRAKLLLEARAASALNHRNICTIYEVGEYEGQPYIAMEYLAGAPLNERVPDEGLPTETVLEYGAQIASALDHAHSHGVLHRDLKSANVRLTAGGQVQVVDFGLAGGELQRDGAGPTLTKLTDSGAVSETLAYLAPGVTGGRTGGRAGGHLVAGRAAL